MMGGRIGRSKCFTCLSRCSRSNCNSCRTDVVTGQYSVESSGELSVAFSEAGELSSLVWFSNTLVLREEDTDGLEHEDVPSTSNRNPSSLKPNLYKLYCSKRLIRLLETFFLFTSWYFEELEDHNFQTQES